MNANDFYNKLEENTVTLARIDERLENVIEDNKEFKTDLKSLNKRVSKLESYKAKATGFILLFPVIIPILLTLLI